MAPDDYQHSHPRSRASSIFKLALSVVLLAAAIWIILHRQYVSDEISYRSFTPSSEVVSLAQATTMSGEATRLFYASHAQVEDRDKFNSHCANAEQSIVLGCYSAQRIYVYNITDERLAGVKQVTAAHEMLHAAYERLSSNERQRVDELLTTQASTLHDERLLNLIELYKKSEPGQLTNELHSILGTEVSSLSPELETYYTRYFKNRQIVVNFSSHYESVFEELKNQQEALSSQLDTLGKEIDGRSEALNQDIAGLQQTIADFNQRARSGSFESQSDFEQQRQQLLARQSGLSSEKIAINGLIDQYNTIRVQLESLNLQAQSLNRSLDSTPDNIPQL